MVKLIDKYRNYLTALIILIVVSSCANIKAPSGGPRDTTPPTIVETDPLPYAVNFKKSSVEITFSNYADKNKVIENLSILPSVKTEFDWSGKTLTVDFADTLKPATTYALTIDAEFTDYLGNKPREAFSLVFSTGSIIDSGKIKGILLDEKPAGTSIFCYRTDDKNPDTLDFSKTKPDFRVRCGSTGSFTIPALKSGKYRVVAVRDELKDDLYQSSTDAFGASTEDVTVTDSATPFLTLLTGPKYDKIPPSLNFAEAVNSHTVRLDFGKALDTASIKPEAFIVKDSAGTFNETPAYAFLQPGENSKVILVTRTAFTAKKKFFAEALRDSLFCVRDTSLNRINDTIRKSVFVGLADPDTAALTIIKQPFKDSTRNVGLRPSFDIVFSAPIITVDSAVNYEFVSLPDKKSVRSKAVFIAPNILRIEPSSEQEPYSDYSLTINTVGWKAPNGKILKDSTVKLQYKTIDVRQYSEVSGKAVFAHDSAKTYVLKIYNADKKAFFTVINPDGTWNFKRVSPGIYKALAYENALPNFAFDFGQAKPYRHAVKLIEFKTEFKTDPRWKFENIILEESLPRK